MNTLQVKRTNKSPIGLSITGNDDGILADGELLFSKKASNKSGVKDIERGVDYLFVGDGENSTTELYKQQRFIRISRNQIPADNSVTTEKIEDGAVTEDKLSFEALKKSEFVEKTAELEQLVISSSSKYSNLTRVHYAYCDTPSSIIDKEIHVADFAPATGSAGVFTLDLNTANGASFYIKFENAHILTAESPTLTIYPSGSTIPVRVLISTNNTIELTEIPIWVNGTPISSSYYWRSGSVINFVLSYTNGAFHLDLIDTDALRTLAQWCDENNTTLINGAMIATGTITAEQIRAGSITTDKIAVGGLSADVFTSDVIDAFNKAINASSQVNKNKTVYVRCTTEGTKNHKHIDLTQEQIDIISTGGVPYQGAGIVISFSDANRSTGENNSKATYLDFFNLKYGVPFSSADGPVVRSDGTDTGYTTNLGELNWTSEENEKENTRLFTYLSGQWIVSKPTSTTMELANWCRENDATYIQGGTLITGKISCSELEAGIINTENIKLGFENNGVFTGITQGSGSTDENDPSKVTTGIKMYSGTDQNNLDDCNYVVVTEGGIAINNDYPDSSSLGDAHANINMWSGSIRIRATGGVFIGDKNNRTVLDLQNADVVFNTSTGHLQSASASSEIQWGHLFWKEITDSSNNKIRVLCIGSKSD